MKDFKYYLEETGEIGYVEQVVHALVYVDGLPQARPFEVVLFEEGQLGQILSLNKDQAEVLLLSKSTVTVGDRAVRTKKQLAAPVSEGLLGRMVDSLGVPSDRLSKTIRPSQPRRLDVTPLGISSRKNIDQPFETGVSIVDLVISLGKGQRQLVVGDRKTGKTQFLLQSAESSVRQGMVCVYAAIAKKKLDVKMIRDHFKKKKILDQCVIVASSSSDSSGLVYLTPFTAMTIAEYFRDLGRDVLVILDDMTAHAKYYREVSLLARRFPGRSSYPGDIFHIHARLMERAGNFKTTKKGKDGKLISRAVSITCLPVAELVMGDLSGYIQTNLMAMTDGHIFFDKELLNEGRRPAINPFLSVTRVGRQAQTPLLRDLNRLITGFLLHIRSLRQFMHFGSELSELTRKDLDLGEKVISFFNQPATSTVPVNVSVILISGLWAGFWNNVEIPRLRVEMDKLIERYGKDSNFAAEIDKIVAGSDKFSELITNVRQKEALIVGQTETK